MDPSPSDRPPPDENDTWVRRLRFHVVSGRAIAVVMLVCLFFTGLLVFPLAGYFQLPTWVSLELLLAAWWLIWLIALTRILYRGERISDDHTMARPRDWVSWMFGGKRDGKSDKQSSGSGWSLGDLGSGDAEGCLWFLAILLAIVVAILGLWLLIEIAIPGIAFLLYFLVRGMLAKVANDNHGCKDDLLKALVWGFLWATLYFAPLAFLVWLGHVLWAGKPPAAG